MFANFCDTYNFFIDNSGIRTHNHLDEHWTI